MLLNEGKVVLVAALFEYCWYVSGVTLIPTSTAVSLSFVIVNETALALPSITLMNAALTTLMNSSKRRTEREVNTIMKFLTIIIFDDNSCTVTTNWKVIVKNQIQFYNFNWFQCNIVISYININIGIIRYCCTKV